MLVSGSFCHLALRRRRAVRPRPPSAVISRSPYSDMELKESASVQPSGELLGRSGEHVHACSESFRDLEATAAVCSLSEKSDGAHDSAVVAAHGPDQLPCGSVRA